jgi:hypothetical protein
MLATSLALSVAAAQYAHARGLLGGVPISPTPVDSLGEAFGGFEERSGQLLSFGLGNDLV